jgi:hypothetical protein
MEKGEAKSLLASLGVDAFLAKPVAESAFLELMGEKTTLISPA